MENEGIPFQNLERIITDLKSIIEDIRSIIENYEKREKEMLDKINTFAEVCGLARYSTIEEALNIDNESKNLLGMD